MGLDPNFAHYGEPSSRNPEEYWSLSGRASCFGRSLGQGQKDFKRWQYDSTDHAVFFLDAVDELKLRQGRLRKALRKISQAIGSSLDRSSFYISCRPNDWNEELDTDALSTLVIEEDYFESEAETPDGEEALVIAISRSNESKKTHKDDEQPTKSIQILTLLPFTRNETLEFANSYAQNQVKAFECYLEENELWHLYCLPNEIILALEQLSDEGKLGNLEEQLQFGIKQKIRELSALTQYSPKTLLGRLAQ